MPRKKALSPRETKSLSITGIDRIYGTIKEILESARNRAYQAANTEMV